MELRGKLEPKKILRGRVDHIIVIDKTLTQAGASADAKVTGEEIAKAKRMASDAQTSANNAQKTANSAGGAAAGALEEAKKAKTAASKAQETADQAMTAGQNAKSGLDGHIKDKNNPHNVKARQLGVMEEEFLVDIGTDWEGEATPYTQTVAVPGMLATDKPFTFLFYPDDLANADDLEYEFSKLTNVKTAENSVTFKAKAPTDIPIQVRLEVLRLGPADDPSEDYLANLTPGPGPISASVNGTSHSLSNMELGPAPSAPGKLSFEII